MAANAVPVAAQAIPNAHDPAAGRPAAVIASAVRTPVASIAPKDTSRAAVSAARRPTTVAPTSSRRPFSSSARVCRTTSMIATTQTSAVPRALILRMDRAPTEDGSQIRPYRPTRAGTALTPSANETREACVGYRPTVAEADEAAVSAGTRTHTGTTTRSRRSANRVSAQVPASSLMRSAPRRSAARRGPRAWVARYGRPARQLGPARRATRRGPRCPPRTSVRPRSPRRRGHRAQP